MIRDDEHGVFGSEVVDDLPEGPVDAARRARQDVGAGRAAWPGGRGAVVREGVPEAVAQHIQGVEGDRSDIGPQLIPEPIPGARLLA
jgi:hypothetical protein